jgi:TolA-binding protein
LAAGALFREGKYAESQATFEAFRSANPGDPLAGVAALGVASCLEAQGKLDEAISAYRDVIMTYPESAAAGQSKLALGRMLEAKNEPQEALQYYEQLRSTAWMNEAELSRQALLAKHPDLAPTNAAPSGVPDLSIPGLATPEPVVN